MKFHYLNKPNGPGKLEITDLNPNVSELTIICPDCKNIINSLPQSILFPISDVSQTKVKRKEVHFKIVTKGFYLVKHRCSDVGITKALYITEAK